MSERVNTGFPFQAKTISMCIVTASLVASGSLAMPPGRAWTPIDILKVNGHTYMAPDRFEPIRDGRIELVARGFLGPLGQRGYGLVWSDSAWKVRWTLNQPNYWIWPALTPPNQQMLVWKTTSPPVDAYYNHLVTANVVGNSVTPPDTIARVSADALVYAGTSWGGHQWVAVRDQNFSVLGFPESLRIFRRDATGPWQRTSGTGLQSFNGMRIAALDSSTVLVLSSEYHAGIHWGYLRDSTFEEQAPSLSQNPLAHIPSLRPRPGGGFIAAWQEFPDTSGQVVVRRFRSGIWGPRETLRVRLPFPVQHEFDQVELSAEGSETPALAWYAYATRQDVAYHIWTSFPTDSGFGIGERLEGSQEGVNPTLVRDENGDVWLAWWQFFEDGIFWVHSYTTARSSQPIMSETAGRPLLRWRLSEPAPETWWAVLRAEGPGPFERVARVRAAADTTMLWADTSAPAGVSLRYAIRRECRDMRYQWTSAEAHWEPRGPSLAVVGKSSNPAADRIDFEVVGANLGALDVRLYDLQGREVLRQLVDAGGAGRDAASVPLNGHLHAGLYLLRVRSADGRLSPAAKIAIVR